jgi:hypothetical protein
MIYFHVLIHITLKSINFIINTHANRQIKGMKDLLEFCEPEHR